MRKAIQRVVGNSFSDKVKEDIFLKFQDRMKDQNLSTCVIAKQVLLDTLNIVSSSFKGSQDTEKLESSEHLYMPSDEGNGSAALLELILMGWKLTVVCYLHHFYSLKRSMCFSLSFFLGYNSRCILC